MAPDGSLARLPGYGAGRGALSKNNWVPKLSPLPLLLSEQDAETPSAEAHPGSVYPACSHASRGCCGAGQSHCWVPVEPVFGFYSNKLGMVAGFSPVSSPLEEPASLTWSLKTLSSTSLSPAHGQCQDGRD